MHPLECRLVLLLIEHTNQCFSGLALLRDVVVCDELELREESPFLLACELKLHIFEAHRHRLILLDIQIELDASKTLARLDVPHFKVVALGSESHCQELERDVGYGFVLTSVSTESLIMIIRALQ